MRSLSVLAILSLLLGLAAGTSRTTISATAQEGPWLPIQNVHDPLVVDIAKFAVKEYYSWDHQLLIYRNVTKGKYQNVQEGTLYWLVIGVKDDDSLIQPYPFYKARVFRRSRDGHKELRYFYININSTWAGPPL